MTFAPDWSNDGGIALITADGHTSCIAAQATHGPWRPNGIALEPGGTFLFAHLGDGDGGLYRLYPDGLVEPVLTELDGCKLPPSNFPLIDRQGRIWLTVSTTISPRARDYRRTARTGFVVLIDRNGPRIVADGLGYANECAISEDGETFWINETFARRTTAFDIAADGALRNRRVVAEWGYGIYPDGLALDREGGLWTTSIVSNSVVRLDRDGSRATIIQDFDDVHVKWAEDAWRADRMGRIHLDKNPARTLRNISNLAFGGPDLRTGFLGCLLGDRIATFQSPVAGVEPSHWRVDLGPLKDYRNPLTSPGQRDERRRP
ncbi:MAG: SMP-30/gluconolactonase/LRE family protein [Pseudomonadota bacterium]